MILDVPDGHQISVVNVSVPVSLITNFLFVDLVLLIIGGIIALARKSEILSCFVSFLIVSFIYMNLGDMHIRREIPVYRQYHSGFDQNLARRS